MFGYAYVRSLILLHEFDTGYGTIYTIIEVNACKDIPERDFLKAVELIREAQGYWVNRIELAEFLNIKPKIVLAKAHKLIKRELLDGYDCGCRGDFEVTSKGKLLLLNAN